jgi:hypothetical protein
VEQGAMILEILKKMQGDLTSVKREVTTLAVRCSAIEDHMRGVITAQFGMQADLSAVNSRLDRIERRLELSEEIN